MLTGFQAKQHGIFHSFVLERMRRAHCHNLGVGTQKISLRLRRSVTAAPYRTALRGRKVRGCEFLECELALFLPQPRLSCDCGSGILPQGVSSATCRYRRQTRPSTRLPRAVARQRFHVASTHWWLKARLLCDTFSAYDQLLKHVQQFKCLGCFVSYDDNDTPATVRFKTTP